MKPRSSSMELPQRFRQERLKGTHLELHLRPLRLNFLGTRCLAPPILLAPLATEEF